MSRDKNTQKAKIWTFQHDFLWDNTIIISEKTSNIFYTSDISFLASNPEINVISNRYYNKLN